MFEAIKTSDRPKFGLFPAEILTGTEIPVSVPARFSILVSVEISVQIWTESNRIFFIFELNLFDNWHIHFIKEIWPASIQSNNFQYYFLLLYKNKSTVKLGLTITVITNSRQKRTNITPLFWSQMVPLLHKPSRL